MSSEDKADLSIHHAKSNDIFAHTETTGSKSEVQPRKISTELLNFISAADLIERAGHETISRSQGKNNKTKSTEPLYLLTLHSCVYFATSSGEISSDNSRVNAAAFPAAYRCHASCLCESQ
jgi:hypothetical protein